MAYRSNHSPWAYPQSWVAGRRARPRFEDLRCYVMFIGQPRSGTSLLGSLLNAHRNMCIAQELDALKYLRRGYDRWQIFWLLLQRDRQFAANGRSWTGYNYLVPNQWQGRAQKLQVIGDKKAGASTERLREDPALLERLRKTIGLPVRMIHLIRDPFNVISTMHLRKHLSLEQSAERFFRRAETNWQLIQSLEGAVCSLRLEDLIAQPNRYLRELCEFLGVDAPDDYIGDCASILFARPRQSKTLAAWPRQLLAEVSRELRKYPFLSGYEYGGAMLNESTVAVDEGANGTFAVRQSPVGV